jgi:folylpolyglutamate synthase/dihydropteroate synthase
MNTIAPPSEWTVVVTLMSDKIAPSMREIFEPYRKLYLYAMDSERAATSDMLQQTLPWGTIIQEPSEIPTQSKQKERSGLVIFTGSLYFYSTVERWVQTIQTTVFRG